MALTAWRRRSPGPTSAPCWRTSRQMRRRHGSLLWLGLIGAVGIGLAILASIPLLRGAPSGSDSSLVGRPAPSLAATDLDGRTWTLADGSGRLTWVNFW